MARCGCAGHVVLRWVKSGVAGLAVEGDELVQWARAASHERGYLQRRLSGLCVPHTSDSSDGSDGFDGSRGGAMLNCRKAFANWARWYPRMSFSFFDEWILKP